MRRSLATTSAVIASLVLVACGDDGDSEPTTTIAAAVTNAARDDEGSETTAAATAAAAVTSVAGDESAAFNDADVMFAQGMIPHHEQAVEMAEIALDPAVGASADVVDLAGRVQQAQDPEIELMTGWLDEWGQPREMDMSGDETMSSMEGMMSDEEMDALAMARDTEFDGMWLEMMSAHHEGAIAMAETEQAEGLDPEAISLAGQIIAAQEAEIEEMNILLAG